MASILSASASAAAGDDLLKIRNRRRTIKKSVQQNFRRKHPLLSTFTLVTYGLDGCVPVDCQLTGHERLDLVQVGARQELVIHVKIVGEGGEVDVEDGGRGAQPGRHLGHRLQEGLCEGVPLCRSANKHHF
jgi:hypothetical protein